MNRTMTAKINPFLLPTCIVCGSPVSLSYVEPATDHEPERRIYRCAECSAEQTVSAPFK
jgi:DNA-directed RNA polymerase subunit RPC12/RpoP